ncbi:RNA polymerase sigma factor SigJ [Sinorhizobium medicae]
MSEQGMGWREELAPTCGHDEHTKVFAAMRPRLLGIAYRILGSRTEADDVVQDTYLRWRSAEKEEITSPGAWLTTVCTRIAIDLLRASYRRRVDYVGSWLPEPLHATTENEAEKQMDLASTLSTAFLLMLERLSPRERAAFLLYEIFDMSYADVAASLDMNEANCRKLVSRAKSHIGDSHRRYNPTVERQRELLAAFQDAVRTGQPTPLAHLLARDVRLTADGGGKVATLNEVISGQAVLHFVTDNLSHWWSSFDLEVEDINGSPSLILRDDGQLTGVLTFAFNDDGQVTDIFVVRNPDKLSSLSRTRIH